MSNSKDGPVQLLDTVVTQLASMRGISDKASLIVTVDANGSQPAIVIVKNPEGEQLFVQSADRTRLCRASYARDGRLNE